MGIPLPVVLAALLCAPCLLVSQTDGNQTGTGRIGVISAALQAHKFDEAIELLRTELGQSPRSAKLWSLEGIALSGKGDRAGAIAAFRRALAIDPDYLAALEGAAQSEYENDDKDAARLLQRIIVLRPGDPISNAMLAEIAYRQGDCSEAVSHFELSNSVLDSQPDALQHFGDCLIKMKDLQKAIEVFQRGAAQPRADPATLYRLASAQLIAQHPGDAIATLQPLIENGTNSVEVLELAAAAYEANGNTPDAVRILHQAIISNPHNADLYVDFANLCLDHQSFQVGVDMMGAGLAAEPTSATLYVARGILYVQLAQYDRAEADFDRADALDPNQSFAAAAEGLAALERNDPDRSLKSVQEKLAHRPNDAMLLYSQAELLAQRGPEPGSPEFREAVMSAEKAVVLNPSLGTARDLLAKLYLQTGQNDAAVEQSRKALSLDPKDQTALYHLIQSLRKSGHQEEVPELLKRLARLRTEGAEEESRHNRYKLLEQAAR